MNKLTPLTIFLLVSINVNASECFVINEVVNLTENLSDLNNTTIDDSQIVTEDDLRFCPEQTIKNANIGPEELPDNGSVWRVGNRRWNDDYEKEYQNWVKNNLTPKLFEELDLATDCADAAIAIRAIFARIYNLPVNFAGNTYKNTSKEYNGTETVRVWSKENWKDDFKKDKRFQKALKNWMLGTGTVNIHNDTYPIKVYDNNFQGVNSCVAPGSISLSQGHAEILTINEESYLPFRLYSSTVPSAVRTLSENIYIFYNPREDSTASRPDRGLLWWNWTINCKGKFQKVKDKDMPYYSDQQHSTDWENVIYPDLNSLFIKSLNLTEEQLQNRKDLEIKFLLESLEKSIDERKSIVDYSIEMCTLKGVNSAEDCYYQSAKHREYGTGKLVTYTINPLNGDWDCIGCSNWESDEDGEDEEYPSDNVNTFDYHGAIFKPKNKELESFYYEHSTPSRDERLAEKYNLYQKILYTLPYEQQTKLKLHLLDKKIDVNGEEISYYHVLEASSHYALSPQPWDDKPKRWGADYISYRKKELLKRLNEDKYYKIYLENKQRLSAPNQNLTDIEKQDLELNINQYEESNIFYLKEIEELDVKLSE